MHTARLHDEMRMIFFFLEGKHEVLEVCKIHLSRDYLLGHRIDAQVARVTGFYTPALQHNKHHPCLQCKIKFTNTANTKQLDAYIHINIMHDHLMVI